MTVSVTVGVLLAALLFMKRMAAVTDVRLFTEHHPALAEPLPPNVLLYEVAGPLFFGAAVRAMSALKIVDRSVSVVVLDLRSVPVVDATGLVNLESTLGRLHQAQVYTVIAGIQPQPLSLMARAGWKHREWLSVYRSFEQGLALARNLALLVTPSERGVASPV
jgi:sulfate permease, SulP family